MTPDHFFILKISNWYLLFFITTIINIATKDYQHTNNQVDTSRDLITHK